MPVTTHDYEIRRALSQAVVEPRFISAKRPSALADFYPDSGIEEIAAAVEKTVLEIVNETK